MKNKHDKNVRYKANLRQRIWQTTGGLCYLCLEEVTLEDMSIDHIYPTKFGGKNRVGNRLPTHHKCNVAKGDEILFDTKP